MFSYKKFSIIPQGKYLCNAICGIKCVCKIMSSLHVCRLHFALLMKKKVTRSSIIAGRRTASNEHV